MSLCAAFSDCRYRSVDSAMDVKRLYDTFNDVTNGDSDRDGRSVSLLCDRDSVSSEESGADRANEVSSQWSSVSVVRCGRRESVVAVVAGVSALRDRSSAVR